MKQLVVLNEIRSRLEMLRSDIIPESESQQVLDAVDNVAANVRSVSGQYGSAYTTRRLSPIAGNVLDLSQSYIRDCYIFNFSIFITSTTYEDIYLMFGPTSTAGIFRQVMLMLGSNNIWQTTYQRTEARILSAAYPASDIDHSPEYATVKKLCELGSSPMKIICIPKTTIQYDNTQAGGTIGTDDSPLYNGWRQLCYQLRFDNIVDLNHLCVPLSNIDYIPYNFGDLRLRTYYDNIEQSMFYFVLPTKQSLQIETGGNSEVNVATINGNSILSLNPVRWGTPSFLSGTNNRILQMGDYAQWIPIAAPVDLNVTTPATSYRALQMARHDAADGGTVTNVSPNGFLSMPILFSLSNTVNVPWTYCFQLEQSQVCQYCFSIDEESKKSLREFFATMGRVPIPTQTFVSTEFANGQIGPTSGTSTSPPSSLISQVSGNNITAAIITLSPLDCPACLLNPFSTTYQLQINGYNINQTTYAKVNDRVIKDYTNAVCDTDTDEINTDFLHSLTFPKYVYLPNSTTNNPPGPSDYFNTTNGTADFTRLKTMNATNGAAIYNINPNAFMHVWQTAIPNSYHTGMCIVENSASNANIRFTGNYSDTYPQVSARYMTPTDYLQQGTVTDNQQNYSGIFTYSTTNLTLPQYTNLSCRFLFTALCDCVINLIYDASIDTCVAGELSYATPFVYDA